MADHDRIASSVANDIRWFCPSAPWPNMGIPSGSAGQAWSQPVLCHDDVINVPGSNKKFASQSFWPIAIFLLPSSLAIWFGYKHLTAQAQRLPRSQNSFGWVNINGICHLCVISPTAGTGRSVWPAWLVVVTSQVVRCTRFGLDRSGVGDAHSVTFFGQYTYGSIKTANDEHKGIVKSKLSIFDPQDPNTQYWLLEI
jgi:hypothetical protein